MKPYEKAKKEILYYLEKHPESTRRDRYRILEYVLGIDEGTARNVDRYLRAIRAVIERDEVGEAREKEWHKSKALWSFENETKQTYLKLV